MCTKLKNNGEGWFSIASLLLLPLLSYVTTEKTSSEKESVLLSSGDDLNPIHAKVRNLILKGYDKKTVPMKNSNQTVNVAVGISLIHIDSLEEGVLTASAWMRMVWNDYRMQWNENDFGGVKVLRINPGDIWVPDIEVYNTKKYRDFSLANQYRNEPCLALVYPDGEVLYIPPVDIKVLCGNFSFTAGPMDEQECNIKLGSWTQDGDVVNLSLFNNKDEMDLSDFYHTTSPYVVTRHIEGTRNVKYYQCCSEPYIDLNFRFVLKRQFPLKEDPKEQLLRHIMGVVTAILIVLLTTTCLAGIIFLRRGGNLGEDTFKLMTQSSTSSGNNLL